MPAAAVPARPAGAGITARQPSDPADFGASDLADSTAYLVHEISGALHLAALSSMKDLQVNVAKHRERGANIAATERPVDTSTAAGKAFFDMLGVIAEFEVLQSPVMHSEF